MLGFIVDDSINFYERLMVNNIESRTASQNSEEVISGLETPLDIYNEIYISLKKADYNDIQLEIVFRVYDNAVAYKYLLNNIIDNRQVTEITELDLYNNTFSKVLRKDTILDSINNGIFPIEDHDTLNLPVTFISEKGYELGYFQLGSNAYPAMKLQKRTSEKSEYNLIYATGLEQPVSVDNRFETPWRMIYIMDNNK